MILLDGIIFSLQRHGGISVYFRELANHLATSSVPASLALEQPCHQEAPAGISFHFRRARLLERYRECRIGDDFCLFHSSYYRKPDRKVATVVTVHDFIYERFHDGAKRWVHSAQKRAAIRAADVVICISEATRRDLLEYVGIRPGQQVQVIHNGVSDIFRPGAADPAARPYLLFVGERRGYKNFSAALNALELLPDFELRCIGGGGFRADELQTVSASARERTRHLGYVSDAELNVHYNGAVCLLYPSSYEGFGIPVLEAMRAGCPVVSADCAAVVEIGGHALTILSDLDARTVADAVLALCTPARRAALIEAGLEVGNRFSWQLTHARTLAAYRELAPQLFNTTSQP